MTPKQWILTGIIIIIACFISFYIYQKNALKLTSKSEKQIGLPVVLIKDDSINKTENLNSNNTVIIKEKIYPKDENAFIKSIDYFMKAQAITSVIAKKYNKPVSLDEKGMKEFNSEFEAMSKYRSYAITESEKVSDLYLRLLDNKKMITYYRDTFIGAIKLFHNVELKGFKLKKINAEQSLFVKNRTEQLLASYWNYMSLEMEQLDIKSPALAKHLKELFEMYK